MCIAATRDIQIDRHAARVILIPNRIITNENSPN